MKNNMKTEAQYNDYISVAFGAVHNVGAGGVTNNKHIDSGTIKTKRMAQWCRRTLRAEGYRDEF